MPNPENNPRKRNARKNHDFVLSQRICRRIGNRDKNQTAVLLGRIAFTPYHIGIVFKLQKNYPHEKVCYHSINLSCQTMTRSFRSLQWWKSYETTNIKNISRNLRNYSSLKSVKQYSTHSH